MPLDEPYGEVAALAAGGTEAAVSRQHRSSGVVVI
jgi:hypothetical protein